MTCGMDHAEGESPSQTTQERLDALKKKVGSDKYRAAARNAGFEDLNDYEQWLVLEELRKLTLANRPACQGGPTGLFMGRLPENPVSSDWARWIRNSSLIRNDVLRTAYFGGDCAGIRTVR
jgi:hypothetical protein